MQFSGECPPAVARTGGGRTVTPVRRCVAVWQSESARAENERASERRASERASGAQQTVAHSDTSASVCGSRRSSERAESEQASKRRAGERAESKRAGERRMLHITRRRDATSNILQLHPGPQSYNAKQREDRRTGAEGRGQTPHLGHKASYAAAAVSSAPPEPLLTTPEPCKKS